MNKILRNILNTFFASGISILYSILKGFIIPMGLSINDYSLYRSIQLISPLAGLTHLGIVDGTYIDSAGKDINKIDKKEISSRFTFLLYTQIITVISISLIVYYVNPVFSLIPIFYSLFNVLTFFNYLFQATNNFNIYKNCTLIGVSIGSLLLTFLYFSMKLSVKNVLILDITYVAVSLIPALIWYKKNINIYTFKNPFTKSNFALSMQGMMVYLGNLLSVFILQMDRWFVKFIFNSFQFAYYSFAISMIMIFITISQAIQKVTFPLLASMNDETNKMLIIKDFLLILGTMFAGAFFILKYIVINYIEKYNDSLEIIALLMIGLPFLNVINGMIINLYKVKKSGIYYLKVNILMLFLTFLVNSIVLLIHKNSESIAIATSITFFIWYVIAIKQLFNLWIKNKELAFLVIYFILFVITSFMIKNVFFGLIVYFTIISVIVFFFYREQIYVFKSLFKFRKQR